MSNSKGKNYLNLGFDVNAILAEDVKCRELLPKIREWNRKKTDETKAVPKNLTDAQLITFIIACAFDEVEVKRCIVENYKCRQKMAETFSKRDLNIDILKYHLQFIELYVCPILTEDGSTIVACRYTDVPIKNFDFGLFIKIILMSAEVLNYQHCRKDIVLIQDIGNFRFGHFWAASKKYDLIRKYLYYLENAIPAFIKKVHILNAGVLWNTYALSILNAFLKSDTLKVLEIHGTDMKMEEFYEKAVPRKYLPSDYGGEQDSMAKSYEKIIQDMRDCKPYFDAEENQRKFVSRK